ncbi:AAA family ATPase [Lentzea sp. NBRC 102530]|uniref:AAA family ATPase n=1 Tax=Lentzea sp. NBRC 102530 TaxID=3032201 RepID=UPI00255694B2|nr:AAA family ATPase [Lentzea sp. NBRC 102530]
MSSLVATRTLTPRALSVRRPWAHLVAAGHKPIENRTWSTSYRGPVAIHAGQRWEAAGTKLAADLGLAGFADAAGCPVGYLGVAELVDVHRAAGCCAPWGQDGEDVFHWVLQGARLFREQVAGRGQLGLYAMPAALELLGEGPAIVAMIGPAGAGKSTWIARNAPGVEVVSLDVGRAALSSHRCVCDQDPLVTALAVELAVATATSAARAGRSVVWDATNADAAARSLVTVLAAELAVRSVAVVLLPPLEVVLARNEARAARHVCGFGRRVPVEVIEEMHREITAAAPTLSSDWDEVVLADWQDVRARRPGREAAR